MYSVPADLDLSSTVGDFLTQIAVGQFDLQFTLGGTRFMAMSLVTLHRGGDQVAAWTQGTWPEPSFYDLMNTSVVTCEVENDRTITFQFENGIEMRLIDDSDEFESIHIRNDEGLWVI
ncbi:MAG: hypothetical protein AAGG01_07780 [Planctomycetota bacterium]